MIFELDTDDADLIADALHVAGQLSTKRADALRARANQETEPVVKTAMSETEKDARQYAQRAQRLDARLRAARAADVENQEVDQ